MERDILHQLDAWKASSHRKPLMLKGARQVGKTWALREFGRARYLGERALGHQDAGATSVSIIISAMRDYVKGLSA